MMTVQAFTGRNASDLAGITYRQLDYWARTNLVRPSLVDAAGSGSRRAYSLSDVHALGLIAELLDAGVRLEQVRTISSAITDAALTDGYLVVGSGRLRLVETDAEIVAALGTGVAIVIDVAAVVGRINDRIGDLATESATSQRWERPW